MNFLVAERVASSKARPAPDAGFSPEEIEDKLAYVAFLRRMADLIERTPDKKSLPCMFLHFIANDDLDEMRKLADGDPSFKIEQHAAVLTPDDLHEVYMRYVRDAVLPVLLCDSDKSA